MGRSKNANGVRNVFLLGRARGPEIYGHLFPSRLDPRCAPGNSVFFRDYKSSVEFGADPSLAQIWSRPVLFLSFSLETLRVLAIQPPN